jgi:hypothetical protein
MLLELRRAWARFVNWAKLDQYPETPEEAAARRVQETDAAFDHLTHLINIQLSDEKCPTCGGRVGPWGDGHTDQCPHGRKKNEGRRPPKPPKQRVS